MENWLGKYKVWGEARKGWLCLEVLEFCGVCHLGREWANNVVGYGIALAGLLTWTDY